MAVRVVGSVSEGEETHNDVLPIGDFECSTEESIGLNPLVDPIVAVCRVVVRAPWLVLAKDVGVCVAITSGICDSVGKESIRTVRGKG